MRKLKKGIKRLTLFISKIATDVARHCEDNHIF
jgi:hypothetical protein